MDRYIIFYSPRDDGTKSFKLVDSEIETISQFEKYRDIVCKKIEGVGRVDYCLHCIVDNNRRYGIFSGTQVVFTKKQKLTQFDSVLDYYKSFIKDHHFELKSINYLTVFQKPL